MDFNVPAPTLDVTVREARDTDAEAVCHIFKTVYGEHYAYPEFYDVDFMKRLIMGEDALTLVAQHEESWAILGTASVVLEVGAMADLVGEFGRLAVLPEARGHGIGHLLMRERLDRVRPRLHMGIVEARITHHHSLTIAQRHGFVPVGFSPLKNLFDVRESIALCAQWFNDGLALRRNHPRIIPEADALADVVMRNAGLQPHAIIDEDSPPYPHKRDFTIDQLTTTGYASLLRIERGRVRNREVFGPMRLQYS
jgi:GNAT superfamily N-acetyltransferase